MRSVLFIFCCLKSQVLLSLSLQSSQQNGALLRFLAKFLSAAQTPHTAGRSPSPLLAPCFLPLFPQNTLISFRERGCVGSPPASRARLPSYWFSMSCLWLTNPGDITRRGRSKPHRRNSLYRCWFSPSGGMPSITYIPTMPWFKMNHGPSLTSVFR